MPPPLSSLLRFKPILQDMRYLAHHLLLPRHAWQHHQREWVMVYEDVTMTLRDRLSRRRLAAMRRGTQESAVLTEESDIEDRGATPSPRITAAELQHLWRTLWELLGAAWRQRDRLWGAYRYLRGPQRLPPVCLNGTAPYALPPGVHASPGVREQYARYIARQHASTPAHEVAAPSEATHAEDTCAFGPFTSVDVGISAERTYVLRHPLAAVLRSLRVSVPPAGRDPLVTTTTAFADFQYVGDSARRVQTDMPADVATSLVVPLFDTTDQDVQLAVAAVPYVSPEVYVSSQQEQLLRSQCQDQRQRRASQCSASPVLVPRAPVHVFSDDVWNAAVVVLEAALSGFCATDASMCHLALSSATDREADRLDQSTAIPCAFLLSSGSVYSDVVLLLTERHALPKAAAHNFIYAALYHLHVAWKKDGNGGGGDGGSGSGDDDDDSDDNTQRQHDLKKGGTTALVLLSPARLAREWLSYLRNAYGATCLQDSSILSEVIAKGLCWRRSQRWNAFAMAHVTATTVSAPAAGRDRSAGAATPLPTPLEMAGGTSGHSSRAVTAAERRHLGHVDDASSSSISSMSVPADADAPFFDMEAPDDNGEGTDVSSVAVGTTTITGVAGVGGASSPPLLSRRVSRALSTLDTPLLRLLNLGHGRATPKRWTSSAEASPAAANLNKATGDAGRDLWVALDHYLRRCTTSATGAGAAAAATGALAAPADKATGAVAEAADVDRADGLLRLLFCCLIRATRWYCTSDAVGEGGDAGGPEWCEYAALNHPFFRGVAERGLLTTCMTVACCSGDHRTAGGECSNAAAAAALPALNLYVPSTVVLATLHELEATWKRSHLDGWPERVVKQGNSLRTLIGDDMRAWESCAAASVPGNGGAMRSQQHDPVLMNSLVDMSATLRPPPLHRARRALDNILCPMDFDLVAQLQHTQELRRLLHTSSGNVADHQERCDERSAQLCYKNTATVATGSTRVRSYLKKSLMPDTKLSTDSATAGAAYSPFYLIPPTLRGEIWGLLLHVPPSAYTREALLAHAVHHTAGVAAEHDRQLSVDIPRCHAYHPLLNGSAGSAQLQRILRAWLYLHPRYTYWQGLDSVCAVLLTVSHTDEALVLAQLNAIVDRFIAHDEDDDGPRSSGVHAAGVRRVHRITAASGECGLGWHRAGATMPLKCPTDEKPSMAELLHRLVVVLRYCDPLLAHHLFDVLSCTPELYAISWFLTLFSHSLPARKVYRLWDLLFVEGDIACLVALCAAVMMQKREGLLSADFSGCLASFSSSAFAVNVVAAVGDTRWLMMAVPPSVLAPPLVSQDKIKDAHESLYGGGWRNGADAVMDGPLREEGGEGVATVALLAIEDMAAALTASFEATVTRGCDERGKTKESSGHQWFHSGVYLVDLREAPAENTLQDAVLGAISVPLCSVPCLGPHAPAVSAAAAAAAATTETGSARQGCEAADTPARPFEQRVDEAEKDVACVGWGVVEQQEQLQEQHRAEQHAAARRVEEAAAAIVRHVGNPSMATLLPHLASTNEKPSALQPQQQPSLSCPWPVHPIALKTSQSPHVVLLTSGTADAQELPLAHQLGLKLNACGLHNVGILRGGVASVRDALPQLVLRRASSA
ncbi:hypothetical protein JKF63_07841 [Porcisia hertigi]|uniref:Rab-GAP TBC domain-containing protein n=1 Tax=Porcisia hertigi TaxID=2761500 RepID=A0A836LMN4_9TRYP|nr:hypothetical protein JKF63_07841 [Porcisia hertigi]